MTLGVQVRHKLSGDKALMRKLKALPKRVRNKVIRSAVNAGARIVAKDAKRRVRRGPTKLLAKSIGVIGRQGKGGYVARVGPRTGFAIAKGNKTYDPSTLGHLIERGTAPHVIPIPTRGLLGRLRMKNIKHPGARPFPFLEPALTSNLGQVQETIRQKMWEGIQREANS